MKGKSHPKIYVNHFGHTTSRFGQSNRVVYIDIGHTARTLFTTIDIVHGILLQRDFNLQNVHVLWEDQNEFNRRENKASCRRHEYLHQELCFTGKFCIQFEVLYSDLLENTWQHTSLWFLFVSRILLKIFILCKMCWMKSPTDDNCGILSFCPIMLPWKTYSERIPNKVNKILPTFKWFA